MYVGHGCRINRCGKFYPENLQHPSHILHNDDDIINGAHPENPKVQILSMKRMPNGAQERFRLLLSDGKWSSSFAMLATQLNNKVANGEIANNCVIQMNRYVCNTVQNNKKVLIILDLTILQTAEEVGGKIGEPVMYDPNKNPQQESAPAAPRVTPLAAPTAQRNVPNATTASPARTPAGGNVHPISLLTPYQNKWTIRARVTHKSDLRTWSNSRGTGKLFSMDLLDESGEIRATAFNEQVDKYMDMIEVNKVYFISGCTLKTANKQYSNLNNDYEMTFNKMTEVIPCHEASDIPTMQFNFVPLDQLESLEKDNIIDIIGVCKEALDVVSLTAKSSGKELRKRDVQLVDDTNREVRLTIWGNAAENFDGTQQPVLAVKGAKLSDFNGRSLSLLSSSTLQINPDIREAHKLKGWFDNGGNTAETINLSNQRGGSSAGMGSNFKTFSEAKLENLGSGDQADYYTTKASVVLIRKENCLYSACPSDGCNKKVVDMNNGLYRCEKCNREYDSFNWRLMLSANLADISDNQWVTVFQDQAEMLLGTTSSELGFMRENNPDNFQNIFTDSAFKNFSFKLRVKMETYNDESRLKTTVVACSPLEPKEYNRRLISEIKQMSGQA
ncbi:replication protein A 70 kDa DNA-binding subunit-like isoform X2 [Penaeus japonicus]|uniref:replication protein A 70 kDa DNA-binding subunit-like isoform X2 n=1 Tax=Penaeus japonicus TaxID=27405 RepID=UPI001C7123DB|nr:replication protein A 70 kDa DNA-binding subunit-like isoform X2 [Penaeus japonicus]